MSQALVSARAPIAFPSQLTNFPPYMSCLSRVGCVTVLALAGAGAWWLYGGGMPSFVRNAASKVGEAKPATGSKPIAWASLNDARISATDALAQLERPTGPAYVTLGPGDVAGFLADGLKGILPMSARGAQVAIVDDRLRLRAAVPLRELGGEVLPSLLRAVLKNPNNDDQNGKTVDAMKSGGETDTVEMAGTLEIIHPGLGQFHVREFRVRDIDVPPRLIPPILRALRARAAATDSSAGESIAIMLPKSIADIRVSRGRITLYKAAPTK